MGESCPPSDVPVDELSGEEAPVYLCSFSIVLSASAFPLYSSSAVCSCCFSSLVPACNCCTVKVIKSRLQRFNIPRHFWRNSVLSLNRAGCSIIRSPLGIRCALAYSASDAICMAHATSLRFSCSNLRSRAVSFCTTVVGGGI
ncbi:hypothetical protein XELAEV_18023112mg [Xenopus laevis]|uniref:Uncharacterized protein n=1 Tax=Xenopus laevis TaxID=8355 RepID=A0A974D609_XENLA|nr:hypothetical protein XELAEV_18023112mg [Xenopus laevis]